jgi:hypothetical protein
MMRGSVLVLLLGVLSSTSAFSAYESYKKNAAVGGGNRKTVTLPSSQQRGAKGLVMMPSGVPMVPYKVGDTHISMFCTDSYDSLRTFLDDFSHFYIFLMVLFAKSPRFVLPP